MENIQPPVEWRCPSCGATNSGQSNFCVKCGFNPYNNGSGQKKPIVWKVILAVILLVVLAAGGFFGYLQWRKAEAEKAAKGYLETQQKFFSDSVSAINGISSELSLDEKYSDEENLSLVKEKLREEKVKAEAAADTVDQIVKNSAGVKANELVTGLDALFVNYLKDAYKVTGKYQDFMRFKYGEAEMNVEVEALWKAYLDRHKMSPVSAAEMKGLLLDGKTTVDKEIALREGLNYPEGLADSYRRGIEELKKTSQLFQSAIDAIDRQDIKRLGEIFGEGGELDDAEERSTEAVKNANSLSKNHFSQMHDEFISLRNKADKIRSEFLILGSRFEVQMLDYSIEGW